MFSLVKQILILFKLRIGVAMAMTAGAGIVAMPGPAPSASEITLLIVAVLLSAGAAGGLNHYHDYDIDARMERTRNRPFVTGALPHSPLWLLFFALLVVVPVALVWRSINPVAAIHVFMGAFFYGVVYTVWLKRRTWLNIVIGGLAGSFAILSGTAILHPEPTPLALSLAFILFLWTPPHFWSLAIALKKEYDQAGIPMLPVVAGESRAAHAVFLNTVLLAVASLLPALFGMGWVYLLGALAGSAIFLAKSWRLVHNPTSSQAMVSFRASLIQLALFLAALYIEGALYPV
ncbi:MAG: protoheme IX farnesyltransferase [Magnetococcales bacterium]|nr:protoheme IX farnesyltransferase [Magnetococcales bacterium]MBF0262434.1 protoheme IX farnesyltransferase [Magnetococcales bacterium]